MSKARGDERKVDSFLPDTYKDGLTAVVIRFIQPIRHSKGSLWVQLDDIAERRSSPGSGLLCLCFGLAQRSLDARIWPQPAPWLGVQLLI